MLMRVVGIVPARIDSKRLPGKALRKVAGRPLIGYVFSRARRITGLDAVVLATTDRRLDQPLVDYARSEGIPVFRGSRDNVAQRFIGAADKFAADFFVRLNGDSPFLDPVLIDQGISRIPVNDPEAQMGQRTADLVTNLPDRTFPTGIAVEIVKVTRFREAHSRMTTEDREHITRHLYQISDHLELLAIRSPQPELADARLVVDTEEDLETFRAIVRTLGDSSTQADYSVVARLELELRTNGKQPC